MKKIIIIASAIAAVAIPTAIVVPIVVGNSSPKTFTGVTFSDMALTYDGSAHELMLSGELPDGADVVYENNSATNVGVYEAKATVSLSGYETLTLGATLTINKATYDLSSAHWDYALPFEYDGQEHSVFITGLPDGVTVKSYSANAYTEVGVYTASAELDYDTANYNAPSVDDLEWAITKPNYDMSSARWEYDKAFTYDGKEHSVTVTGLPDGVTVKSYSNNKYTNAGSHIATVQFNYDEKNHNEPKLNELIWTINKATYDMSSASWSYKLPFLYNEKEHSVTVTGLPVGVTVVSYTDNVKTEAGVYTASVKLDYDKRNYNAPSMENCVWRILPDLSTLSNDVVNSMMKIPDPWSFLPESFALENKVYTGNTEIDFSSFVNVSSLPKGAMGKQMNVVYSALIYTEEALGYVRKAYGYINVIVDLYQNYINSDPDNYKNFEKTTDNFTVKIVLDESDYNMYLSLKSVSINLSYELKTKKCYGRVQLTESNALKYEFSENEFTVAASIFGLSLTKLHLEKKDDNVSGYLYEYAGTETKNIKTSALIKVDENYTTIISNKRETDDLIIEGYMEVYKNSTGNLVGAEVRETVKNTEYETSWFNLWDVNNINTIKVDDETNGINMDTIYINGSANPIKTKLVGWSGGLAKSTSRRFDIEMKDVYVYTYDSENEKYDKVKMSLPMLFVQNDYISSFETDFYNANKNTGAVQSTKINLNSADSNYLYHEYSALINEYVSMKNSVTYNSIVVYIGTKS